MAKIDWSEFTNIITHETKIEFRKLTKNVDRVNWFLRQFEHECNADAFEFAQLRKSNTEAVELEELGHGCFDEKEFERALEFFTKCICCAETPKVLATGYANRSSVLFELKQYQSCIEDIERALSLNYPDNKGKIFTRRANALRALKFQPKRSYYHTIPTFSEQEKNALLKSASNAIKFKVNEEIGCHLVADRDIRIGEVIVIEKAFARCTSHNEDTLHCHECLELCYNPIPCGNCCTSSYCSEECRLSAWNACHQFECTMVGVTENFAGNRLLILALKITMTQRYALISDVETVEIKEDSEFHSNRYEEVYNMKTNIDKIKIKDLINHSCSVAVMFSLVKYSTNFFDGFEDRAKVEDRFKELFLRNVLICESNPGPCTEMTIFPNVSCRISTNRKYRPDYFETVGWTICPLVSMFRHSCVANCFGISYGSSHVVRACANIKEGDECFVDHGFSFISSPKIIRQARLRNRFHFLCKCISCVDNWPVQTVNRGILLYNKARQGVYNANEVNMLRIFDVIVAKQAQKTSPTLEDIVFCIEIITRVFKMFGNKTFQPYSFKN